MTLDSILEGILDEEQSSAVPGQAVSMATTGPGSTRSSSSSCHSPDQSGQISPSVAVGSGRGMATIINSATGELDSIADIPCISIKTELPDSCSMDLMARQLIAVCTSGGEMRKRRDDSRRHSKHAFDLCPDRLLLEFGR